MYELIKKRNKILFAVLFASTFFLFSVGCRAQGVIDPSKGTTNATGNKPGIMGPTDPTILNVEKTGDEAATKVTPSVPPIPTMGAGTSETIKTGDEAATKVTPSVPPIPTMGAGTSETIKTGTAAETSIPGGNLNPSSTTATGASNARTGSTGGLVPCTDDCTLCHLALGFKNIYDYLLVLLLSATTLVVVAAGVMYMVSSGDKGMIDKAKSALTYALTAMILALTAWLIINATLNALGFKNAGSWYNFTCDTTQTQGPTGGTGGGGATLPGTPGAGGRSGSYTPSGNLDPRVQKVLNNFMTMDGMKYGQSFDNAYGGRSTAVCGSTASRAWMMDGLPDYEKLKPERWDGDPNSLKPGDICLFDKKVTGIDHAFLVMEGGKTSGANNPKGIYVSSDGLNQNIKKLNGNTSNLYVFRIAKYLK